MTISHRKLFRCRSLKVYGFTMPNNSTQRLSFVPRHSPRRDDYMKGNSR